MAKSTTLIKTVTHSACGAWVIVSSGTGAANTITYRRGIESAELKALAIAGGDMQAVRAYIKAHPAPTAKMARGLNAQNSPQTAAAIKSARYKEKKEKEMVKAATKKATKTTKAKADKAVKAKPAKKPAKKPAAKATSAEPDNRKITVLLKDYSFGAEGSKRNASWLACKKAKTVQAYIAAGGARKYLNRWVAAKAIALS